MRRRLPLRAFVFLVGAGLIALVVSAGHSPRARPHRAAVRSAQAARPALYASPRSAAVVVSAQAKRPRCTSGGPPEPSHPLTHRQWLTGVVITEYYPAPEPWFIGRRVAAPGLPGTYAVDWLYSARGLAMEGDGVDRRGRRFHIDQLGASGWVNVAGRTTRPRCLGLWSDGPPAWLNGGWRNRSGAVTFPLAGGGWSNGRGVRRLDYGGVSFAPGPSLPLHYYHSIAVDPKLIPLGSRVYIPAYRRITGGWFTARDTGGAIRGRHVDVYRPAPASPNDLGRYMRGQRIYVIPPG